MKGAIQPEFVTIPEAQRRTGLGCRQFRRAIADGDLAVYDLGWPRLRWGEILRWAEARRRQTADVPAKSAQARESGQ